MDSGEPSLLGPEADERAFFDVTQETGLRMERDLPIPGLP
jgi:hypothetical protein